METMALMFRVSKHELIGTPDIPRDLQNGFIVVLRLAFCKLSSCDMSLEIRPVLLASPIVAAQARETPEGGPSGGPLFCFPLPPEED